MAERDYVLGTHDEELERLGIQHRVWRPYVLDAWRRAGIQPGSQVVDAGAGPGYATADLADVVGPNGRVLAVERSERYAEAIGRLAPAARVQVADLMESAIDTTDADAVWCRWVACFVPSPERLVDRVAAALKPGGVFVSHEYLDYASWRYLPRSAGFETFVTHVIRAWRDSGGEPNIALALPQLLVDRGFTIREARPLVFAARPSDGMWRWPASFIRVGAERLRSIGQIDEAEVQSLAAELEQAERDGRMMITPVVLELIAVLPSALSP